MPVVLEVLSIQQKSLIYPNDPGNHISFKNSTVILEKKVIIYIFGGRIASFSPSLTELVKLGAAWPRVRDVTHKPPLPPTSFFAGGETPSCLSSAD